jgi:hypothetical protein
MDSTLSDIEANVIIHLDSNYADNYFLPKSNGSHFAHCYFELPNININKDYTIYYRLVNFQCPYSFYQINSTNNLFSYTLITPLPQDPDIIINKYIPEGNYNINDILNWFSTETDLSATYNKNTMKITLTHPSQNFRINSNSTCNNILGFTSDLQDPIGQYLNSQFFQLEAPFVINMNPIKNICISTNIMSQNFVVHKASNLNVLACLNISDALPGDIISYDNIHTFYNNTYSSNLMYLEVKISDNNMNVLNLNGHAFTLTLELAFVKDKI